MLGVRSVYVEEIRPLRHVVLRPGSPYESTYFSGDDAIDTRHFAAELDHEIVGCASVMVVLLSEIYRTVAEPMWCHARKTAIGFYQRNGWQVVSDEYEIQGVGHHVRMVWYSVS